MGVDVKNKTAYMGLLLAFALILSYIESLVPFYFGIPGVKLGLANLAVILALYLFGPGAALAVNVLRVVLSGLMFGNLFMIVYSLAGASLSFVVMCLLKRFKGFSMIGVSVAGGVSHNIGQILVAYFVVQTPGVYYYLPVLLIAGTITGLAVGTAAKEVYRYVERKRQ